MKKEIINKLKEKSKKLRKETLKLIYSEKEGHLGSSFSIIEILVSLYGAKPFYNGILKKEDKFILSKGHGCVPYYLLLRERGYSPKIFSHPEIDLENGISCTTGSLGHGFPIGVGMAFAKKMKNEKGRIYVLMGDGECQEGTTWESLLQVSQHNLDNLTVIIDYNKLQILDKVENILSIKYLPKIFKAYRWKVDEINGHDYNEIIPTLNYENIKRPQVIIAHTTKGKGVSFMENEKKWHGNIPNKKELKLALEELI